MTAKNFSSWRYDFGNGSLQGYASAGEEGLPTLHFLHGNGFAVQTYRKFLSCIGNYPMLLQEAAGHGLSDVDESFVGWNKTAQRFADSLEQVGKQQLHNTAEIVGVGHSFGGCMTALMSAQNPKAFSRLVLLDPALFPPKHIMLMKAVRLAGLMDKVPMVKRARKRRTHWDSYDQVHHNFYERGTFKGWEPECLADYIEFALEKSDKGYELRCPTWMEAAIFGTYPKKLWRRLAKISVPTYIVYGEDTFPMFQEAYRLAARKNPNVRLVKTQGDHCFMQQHPEQAGKLVADILKIEE
ncbi:alpha/beta fold hydrolase [Marinomonas epiphytica]